MRNHCNKFILILGLIIFSNIKISFCQVNNESIDTRYKGGILNFRKDIQSNIKFPIESFQNKQSGLSIAELKIDSTGKLISIEIINSIDTYIDNEVIRTMNFLKENWKPSTNGLDTLKIYTQIGFYLYNPITDNYIEKFDNFILPLYLQANFDGEISKSDDLLNDLSMYLKKNDHKKVILICNELIKLYPYSKKLYELRINSNNKLGKKELVESDINRLKNFIDGKPLDYYIN